MWDKLYSIKSNLKQYVLIQNVLMNREEVYQQHFNLHLSLQPEVVVAAIKKAHDLAHLMYPDLDTETQLFGTIRSKLADQILYVWSKKGQ